LHKINCKKSAIPSLVDALSGMIDVIKKANGAKVSEISSGITSLGTVVQFIGKVYNAVAAISGAQGLGGAIAGFLGGKPADKIKAAHEILIGKDGGPGINQIINDISTIAQTTAGLSISNTSSRSLGTSVPLHLRRTGKTILSRYSFHS
jgi:hypothetical protein